MKNILLLLLAVAFLFGCDSLLEDQQPQNSVDPSVVFNDAPGARSAIIGAYDALQSASYFGGDYLLLGEVIGGNLSHTGTFPSYAQIANRAILTDNANVTNMWTIIYSGINRANQVIDKVPVITDPALTDAERSQLIGEAHFLRAFNYFNLVKWWGGVPLKLAPSDAYTPSEINIPRATAAAVYDQIIIDLDEAIAKLTANVASKARVQQRAAYGLKARVLLYQNKYTEAIDAAIEAGTGYSLVSNYLALWETRNTTESIFEIQFNTVDTNTLSFYLLTSSTGGRNEVRPSAGLAGAYLATDARRILTTSLDSRLRYYRAATDDDNVIAIRLAEMLLIRAEALVERNTGTDLADAVVLINQIRTRAGIGTYAGAVTQTALRDEVFIQRRLEFPIESHYFFDLVRTGRAASTLSSPVWNDNQALLPIPLREINASGGILTQNPGY
jgi:starch-binding outer membrane protein, SusD/RagB family